MVDPFFVHNLHTLAHNDVVDKIDFIIALSKNKRVLHFGFLDSPLLAEKLAQNLHLHQKIKHHTRYLFGVDIDEATLQEYRALTKDNDNMVHDITQGAEVPSLVSGFDIILFPEVLEHMPNPGTALTHLRKLCVLNKNAQLCVTVPNAFAADGVIAALHDIELVHPTHYYYFSPVTLTKLLSDHGFTNIQLLFYGLGEAPSLTKKGIIALCEPKP